MYPQDFPVERVTPVLGLPMALLGLALLGLAAWGGYALARLRQRERRPSSRAVAASIHAAVQSKLAAALSAHGGATVNAAQALVDEIDIRLGEVLAFAGALAKADRTLRDAIAGKREAPPPPASVAPASPHAVIIPIPGQGQGSSAAAAAGGGPVVAMAEAGAGEGGLAAAVLRLPPAPPAPPPPPTAPEQIAAVRAAIEAFAVHFGATPSDPASRARIEALEAAAVQLGTAVPAPKPGPVPGA